MWTQNNDVSNQWPWLYNYDSVEPWAYFLIIWISWKKRAGFIYLDINSYITRSSSLHLFQHTKPQTINMSATHSQSLSGTLVISGNLEGLTAIKSSILSEMFKEEKYQCLCLQETHRALYKPSQYCWHDTYISTSSQAQGEQHICL